jgi:tetratricopeptide (TPR) repeat protein
MDVLDGLSSLADKSLVRPDLAAGDDPRFQMLGTIRDYALERLQAGADFAELSRRHALVYLALTEALTAQVLGPDARAATDRLELDHDNIRAALDWAVANGETQVALRFIVATWRFWQRRGHLVEARRRIEIVMAMPGLGAQPDELLADAFGAAGGITYWQADAHATYRYYSQALAAAERSGDKRLIARALYDHGFAAVDADRLDDDIYRKGRQLWLRSLELYRELGDPQGIADAAWGLSQAYSADDDVPKALEYAQQALDGYRQLGDQFRIGWGAFVVATVQVRVGDLAAAEQNLRESLAIFAAANDRGGMLMNLAAFFLLARQRGQRTRELRLGGAAMKLRASTGTGLLDVPLDVLQFTMPVEPTDPAEQLLWQEGERMSPEEAAAYALSDEDANKP